MRRQKLMKLFINQVLFCWNEHNYDYCKIVWALERDESLFEDLCDNRHNLDYMNRWKEDVCLVCREERLKFARTTSKTWNVAKSTAVEITNKFCEVLPVLILPKYYSKQEIQYIVFRKSNQWRCLAIVALHSAVFGCLYVIRTF